MQVPPELFAQLKGHIVSDHGSSLVGSAVIIKNGAELRAEGANFRLQNVNQTPLADVDVLLEQADGTPVLGTDGLPVRARTDPYGNYVLKAGMGEDNLLVKVALPTVGGELMALAYKDATRIDVDITSTLAMSYIVSNYVLTQHDPNATLNKLPPDLEAQVESRTEVAIAQGNVVTKSLSKDILTKTVEGLRKADPTLDQHMETVKKLLVAAGLSDLGNGKPATQVRLPQIQDILPTNDGGFYLCCPADARVWKLRSDGILENVAGRAPNASDALVEGLKATAVGLRGLLSMSVGTDGTFWLLLSDRLLHVDATGITHELWKGNQAQAALALDNGKVLLLQAGAPTGYRTKTPTDPPKLWLIGDGVPRLLHTFTIADREPIAHVRRFVKGNEGAYYLGVTGYYQADHKEAPTRVLRLSADTYALTEVRSKLPTDRWISLTHDGEIITAAKSPIELGAGLTFTPQTGPNQPGPTLNSLAPVTRTPAGNVLVATEGLVFQVDALGTKLIAGTLDSAQQTPAEQLNLESPSMLAIEKSGAMLVFDKGTRLLWRIDAGVATRYAEIPTVFTDGEMIDVSSLRCCDNGELLIGSAAAGQIYRLDGQKQLTRFFTATRNEAFDDTLLSFEIVGRDLYILRKRRDNSVDVDKNQVLRLAPDGSQLAEWDLDASISDLQGLFKTAEDAFYLVTGSDTPLYRWVPGQSATLIDTSQQSWAYWINFFGPDFATDKKGRIISAFGDSLYRFDTATGALEVLVGPEGRLFKETSVDSGAGHNLINPCFDAVGNLFFVDADYRQIKRIAAAELN